MLAETEVAGYHHGCLNDQDAGLGGERCMVCSEMDVRTKDATIVTSSHPIPDLLSTRLQNLIAMKRGVMTKRTIQGIRIR